MDWGYFDKFDAMCDKYLPPQGEGETLATQTVTAVCKLVYKWYNDGDVFDNVHSGMRGWFNDLSSYANWLYEYRSDTRPILERVYDCYDAEDYEKLLADLADMCFDEETLEKADKWPAEGSVYKCDGPFEFSEEDDWEGDDWDEDDDW